MCEITSIFVYGTLKRGQCREKCWPRKPIKIQVASTLGELYDLGPYPALLAGTDNALGEVWTFASADMPETLRVLDQIECFGQGEVDLYLRKTVGCAIDETAIIEAYCYFLADPALVSANQRIFPDATGFCRWPANSNE